jgi:uncharacterized OsmC-like protein
VGEPSPAAGGPSQIRTVLDGARALLHEHPQLGTTTQVARAVLLEGTAVDVRTGGHTFRADEPAIGGGTDTGPSPTQYALGALASCTAIVYRYWSELLGIALGSVAVEVRGTSDLRGMFGFAEGVGPEPSGVSVVVTVDGPDVDRYPELHGAVERHCPVLATVAGAIPVDVELRIGS